MCKQMCNLTIPSAYQSVWRGTGNQAVYTHIKRTPITVRWKPEAEKHNLLSLYLTASKTL